MDQISIHEGVGALKPQPSHSTNGIDKPVQPEVSKG